MKYLLIKIVPYSATNNQEVQLLHLCHVPDLQLASSLSCHTFSH